MTPTRSPSGGEVGPSLAVSYYFAATDPDPRLRALGLRWRHCLASRRSRSRPRLVDRLRLPELLRRRSSRPSVPRRSSPPPTVSSAPSSGAPTARRPEPCASPTSRRAPARLHLPIFWRCTKSSLGGRPHGHRAPGDDRRAALAAERFRHRDGAGRRPELADLLVRAPRNRPLSLFEPERGSDCFEGVGDAPVLRAPAGASRRRSTSFAPTVRSRQPEPIFHALPPREGACGHQGDRLLYAWVPTRPATTRICWRSTRSSGATEMLLASGAVARELAALSRSRRSVRSSVRGFELLRTDGTAAGTTLLACEVGGYGARIDRFLGEVVVAGAALWITDADEPTGARLLLSDDGGDRYVAPELAPLGPTLVFLVSDEAHGGELWTSDGTAEGTGAAGRCRSRTRFALSRRLGRPLLGIRRRRSSSEPIRSPSSPAETPSAGEELWVTDGTALGTGLLRDIYPGDYPSTPRQFTRLGNRIVFSAEDEEHGLELWVTDGTYPGTTLLKDVAAGTRLLGARRPRGARRRSLLLRLVAQLRPRGVAERRHGCGHGAHLRRRPGTALLLAAALRPRRQPPLLLRHRSDPRLRALGDLRRRLVPLFLDGFETSDTLRWSEAIP